MEKKTLTFRKPHFGEILTRELKARHMDHKDLAKLINIKNANAYQMMRRKTIGLDRLHQISTALGYNFLNEYNCSEEAEAQKKLNSENEATIQRLLKENETLKANHKSEIENLIKDHDQKYLALLMQKEKLQAVVDHINGNNK